MSSTGMSLNERFTKLSNQVSRGNTARGRSRSRSRNIVDDVNKGPRASAANMRLLNDLKKKHAMQAALKLKRRSLRTATNGGVNKRVGVKSLRLAPNGRPIRTNTTTRVATMRADLVGNNVMRGNGGSGGGGGGGGRALRRTNSTNNLTRRLGIGRPNVGGAAERIARRRLQRPRGRSATRAMQHIPQQQQQQVQLQQQAQQRRGRSRSRSRGRQINANNNNMNGSGYNNRARPRSLSRGRAPNRNRGRQPVRERPAQRISVKDRLGARPRGNVNTSGNQRRAIPKVRGVANGRIQKWTRNGAGNVTGKAVVGSNTRVRGRSAVRNAAAAGAAQRSRSRSRTRSGNNAAAATTSNGRGRQQQQNVRGGLISQNTGRQRRGRSLQRRGGPRSSAGTAVQGRNGKQGNQQQQQQKQMRRGRSRSRGRVGNNRNNGGKGNAKPDINKDELDKELDQYMATPKTEMDYLLK